MTARYRWLPAEGQRHAVPNDLYPGLPGRTLCGVAVTVPCEPIPKVPNWLWPECPSCDGMWREHERMNPRHVLSEPCSAKTGRVPATNGVRP